VFRNVVQKRDGDKVERSVKNEETICIVNKERTRFTYKKKGRISELVTACVEITF
jgi:hypothetical protein